MNSGLTPKSRPNLGIKDGSKVEVTSKVGKDTVKAKVTDFIHPEAVFMLHGFGKTVPVQTRCYQKGGQRRGYTGKYLGYGRR